MSGPSPKSSLAEISHLFLSSVRQRQTGGAPPPRRVGPAPASVDLSPEEFGRVLQPAGDSTAPRVPPARGLLAAHLGEGAAAACRAYAAAVAAGGSRVGLIRIDAAEFHICTFEPEAPAGSAVPLANSFDPRAIRDAVNELSCDLDLWLVAPANPRLPEARNLLRQVSHWVLLTQCDHESIIAAYRALKGVEDLGRPRLTIAPVPGAPAAEAHNAFARLAAVAGQFLQWPAEPQMLPAPASSVGCDVLRIAAGGDKAQTATAAHWQVVEELLEQARLAPQAAASQAAGPAVVAGAPALEPVSAESATAPSQETETSMPTTQAAPGPRLAAPAVAEPCADVIDLPEEAGPEAILDAVLAASGGELIACPIRPPACPSARLTVTRQRRLVVLALAQGGLHGLDAIGQALRWVADNRQLLAMALPQFALEGTLAPGLHLLVDHADARAELLQPLFALGSVRIQTYRRLRWAGRVGLLLEAA